MIVRKFYIWCSKDTQQNKKCKTFYNLMRFWGLMDGNLSHSDENQTYIIINHDMGSRIPKFRILTNFSPIKTSLLGCLLLFCYIKTIWLVNLFCENSELEIGDKMRWTAHKLPKITQISVLSLIFWTTLKFCQMFTTSIQDKHRLMQVNL